MEPKICTKLLRNFSENREAKVPATPWKKLPCLNDAFSEIFKLEEGPVKGQSLLQKDKKKGT